MIFNFVLSLYLADVNFEKWRIANKDPNLKRRIVEEFVARFINLMKREYGKILHPLIIDDVQFVKLKHWGMCFVGNNITNIFVANVINTQEMQIFMI